MVDINVGVNTGYGPYGYGGYPPPYGAPYGGGAYPYGAYPPPQPVMVASPVIVGGGTAYSSGNGYGEQVITNNPQVQEQIAQDMRMDRIIGIIALAVVCGIIILGIIIFVVVIVVSRH